MPFGTITSTNMCTRATVQIYFNYFETIGLKNADLIFKAANQQFLNGEIDYLKWAFLVNQSIDIQSNYYDALNNLNESIIQINYLTVQ